MEHIRIINLPYQVRTIRDEKGKAVTVREKKQIVPDTSKNEINNV